MSFLETVEKARVFLERNGRVSLRALQREFELDDDALDELVEELVDVQQVAVREGQILVWVGPARSEPLITKFSSLERALRNAHRLYTEIGATGHAQRLAKELGL